MCVCVHISQTHFSNYSCCKVGVSTIAANSYFLSQSLGVNSLSLFSLYLFCNGSYLSPQWMDGLDSSKGYTLKKANRNAYE